MEMTEIPAVGKDGMNRFNFKKLDAFAVGFSEGNPAGAVYLDSDRQITDEEMLRIARHLKGFVSEVGFVRRLDEETFGLRYFSAEREVEFCGHATIAILYDLLKNDAGVRGKPSVAIVTPKGKLLVENRISSEDAVYVSAPEPVFSAKPMEKEAVADALDIDPGAVHGDRPIAVVNAGLETLIVPMTSLDAVLSMAPSLEKSKAFCRRSAIDIITVFTDDTADPANRFRTRVIASTYGYLEDPATGSGNAALGYHLLQQGLWDGKSISIEQNGSREQPNIVKLSAAPTGDGAWHVEFGGNAVVRISGEFFLA
jgi:PhzF family phenazine biosynthesis protein